MSSSVPGTDQTVSRATSADRRIPRTGVSAAGRWLKASSRRNVVRLALGTAAGQLLAVLLSPVISRLYSPADFGLLGTFVALVTILNVVGTLRYELAIPLPRDERSAINLFVLGLACNVVIVVGMFLALVPLADPIAHVLGAPALATYLLWLLPPTLLATGAYQLFSYWAVRRKEYLWLARRNFQRGAAGVLSQVGLGAIGIAPGGLLLGTAAGNSAGSLGIARRMWRHEGRLLRQASTRDMLAVGRRYIRFPIFASWSGLVNSAGVVLPFLVLSRFFGPVVAGWFTLTSRVVVLPVSLVGDAVGQVYLGEAAAFARQTPEQMRSLFGGTTKKLMLIGTPPLLAIALSAKWSFPMVFGARWREAGLYALILLPMYLAQFVVVPLSRTLSLLERQGLQLAWDVLRLLLTAISLALPWHLGGGPRLTVASYSLAMTLAYVTLWSLSQRALAGLPRPEARR